MSITGVTHSSGVGISSPAASAVCWARIGYWPPASSAAISSTSPAFEPKWYEIAEGFLIPTAVRMSRVEVAWMPFRPMRSRAASYKRAFASPWAMVLPSHPARPKSKCSACINRDRPVS